MTSPRELLETHTFQLILRETSDDLYKCYVWGEDIGWDSEDLKKIMDAINVIDRKHSEVKEKVKEAVEGME